MAFTIDRVEAARRLSVSTRTVDRHIKSGKINTKRIGKKMFLDEDDIESLRKAGEASLSNENYVVILDTKDTSHTNSSSWEIIDPKKEKIPNFATLYSDAQKTIAKKDEIIQDLSYRIGKVETELKSAIPLVEYRKTTFLLESAKLKSDTDATWLGNKIEFLEKEITKRNSAILGLAILFVLVLAFSAVFFLYTKLVTLG